MVATLGLSIQYHVPPDADHSRPVDRWVLAFAQWVSDLSRLFHMTVNAVTRPKGLHRSVSEGKVDGSIGQI